MAPRGSLKKESNSGWTISDWYSRRIKIIGWIKTKHEKINKKEKQSI